MSTFSHIFIDCLPSPTYLFSGLAPGNRASERNYFTKPLPKKAALESLEKMDLVRRLGGTQLVMPPIPRPDIAFLYALGFPRIPCSKRAWRAWQSTAQDEALFRKGVSSSAMWTANWAHTTPSCDSSDGRLHISVANLACLSHRLLESGYVESLLRHLFQTCPKTTIHSPLPQSGEFHDEGSANDIRFSNAHGDRGFFLYVWGRNSLIPPTKNFPARQTLEACRAIPRRHRIPKDTAFFLQQHPDAIDRGVFHNDVIAFGTKNLLVCHERAYLDQKKQLAQLQALFYKTTGEDLIVVEIPDSLLSLEQAVDSYFFNGQVIDAREEGRILLLPEECRAVPRGAVDMIQPFFKNIQYVDIAESMKNGGGPACLRLQITLDDEQKKALPQECMLSDALYDLLSSAIHALYPDEVSLEEVVTTRESLQSLLKAEEAIAVLVNLHLLWKKEAHRIGLKRFI